MTSSSTISASATASITGDGTVTRTAATIPSSDYGTAPVTKLDSSTLSPSQTPTQSKTISSTYIGGVGDSSGISALVVSSPTTFSDLLMNGGIAAAIALMLTAAVIYFLIRKRVRTSKLSRPQMISPTVSSPSFSVINPLKEQQKRQLQRSLAVPDSPRSRPPNSAMKSYAETVKDEGEVGSDLIPI
jgi:hypothetical protein